MSDASSESHSESDAEEQREAYLACRLLFEAAFDELHAAVVEKASQAGKFIPVNSSYPRMSKMDSGFPTFHEVGFYDESAPKYYMRLVTGSGLMGLLGGYRRPTEGFPRGAELSAFLRESWVGARFQRTPVLDDDDDRFDDWQLDHILADAVERYLQLYGVGTKVDRDKRHYVLRPLYFGSFRIENDLRLVVPIALTHFDVDRFRLSDTTYITKIPKKIQLARAQLKNYGSGAVHNVVGAATHAFVSEDWKLNVANITEVDSSLRHVSAEATDTIAAFFGALRLATGVRTGYAQALWVPKRWALRYSADLPPVYGTTMRQYPDDFDNYVWAREGDRITREQISEVQTLYQLISENENNQIRLAIKRLNACMTRADDIDGILDAAIGLELLLNDDENQSLSYKLRLRCAALTLLDAEPEVDALEMAARVKRLYGIRSTIVHGRTPKKNKNAVDTGEGEFAKARAEATSVLRFVIDRLLRNPRYLNPLKIDDELMLGPRPQQS